MPLCIVFLFACCRHKQCISTTVLVPCQTRASFILKHVTIFFIPDFSMVICKVVIYAICVRTNGELHAT
uniref:Uncharacterized protein n=1 Tax=Ixodes scapularis TaxID=6945 RepID=A0A4D5RYM2_IXOSC